MHGADTFPNIEGERPLCAERRGDCIRRLFQQVDRKSANFSCDFGAIERNRQIGLDIARLRPAVVTRPVESDGVERLLADHPRHLVRGTAFYTGALFLAFDNPPDSGSNYVRSGDAQFPEPATSP